MAIPGGGFAPRQPVVAPKPKPPRRALAVAAAGGPMVAPPPAAAPPVSLPGAPAGISPIQAQAWGEVQPSLSALQSYENDYLGRASAAIKGLTDAYAAELAKENLGAPYAGSEVGQAAVDAALQQSLANKGDTLAQGLENRLQAIAGSSGGPAVQQAAAELAAQGRGAGNAEFANGSAALSNLIADAAAANEYGAKLPGIAKLAGIQQLGQAQGQAQTNLDNGLLQATSELPTIIQQIKADQLQAQATKATKAYDAAKIAQGAQRVGIEGAKAAASIQQGNDRIAQGNSRLAISQQNANTAAARAAQTAYNENRNAKLSLARIGIEDKRLQLEALAAQAKLANGGFTAEELVKLRADAGQVIVSGKQNGYSRGQIINNLVANEIPLKLASPLLKRFGYAPPGPGLFAGLSKALKQAGGSASPSPFGGAAKAVESAAAQTIVGLAHDYLGTPYQWGGESPKGFDCSGFAQYLYGKAGVSIPRTTYTQWTAPNGVSVSKGELRPGDLVFFKGSDAISQGGRTLPGHVGVYIGGGKMIDAPHTGADVRVESVASFGGYMGARRYQKAGA